MLGERDEWSAHLKGIAEKIRIKGGLSAITVSLQTKMCRYGLYLLPMEAYES
jgi:hypothetical protein